MAAGAAPRDARLKRGFRTGFACRASIASSRLLASNQLVVSVFAGGGDVEAFLVMGFWPVPSTCEADLTLHPVALRRPCPVRQRPLLVAARWCAWPGLVVASR